MDAEDRYYRLDNSAVFMAAIADASGPFVFRLACELREPVRIRSLQGALEALQPRFPMFFVALRRGVFWHYLDPVTARAVVEREDRYPCRGIPYSPGRPLLRVLAYRNRIACEFHHAITDGTGASVFLRSMILEYLLREGKGDAEAAAAFPLPRPGQAVPAEEEEDSYARYFKPGAPVPKPNPPAFLIGGGRLGKAYRETRGVLPLAPVLAEAKRRSASLTEFLAAIHLAALQDLYEELPRRRRSRKNISVQIPVNLRKIYPSGTLRNFFLFAAPSVDLRLGHWTFDELLRRVHHELRIGMEEKELLRQLKRNVGGERNLLGRPILLPIKNLVLRIINATIGVGAFSGSLSNLGSFELPVPFDALVQSFSITPSRARRTGANIGVLSWKDRLYIHIGSSALSRDFERRFFSRLAAFGFETTVSCNIPFDDGGFPL